MVVKWIKRLLRVIFGVLIWQKAGPLPAIVYFAICIPIDFLQMIRYEKKVWDKAKDELKKLTNVLGHVIGNIAVKTFTYGLSSVAEIKKAGEEFEEKNFEILSKSTKISNLFDEDDLLLRYSHPLFSQ